ncbi:MAG: hypothetical protein ACKOXO_06080 [Cyanobium sp.]
MTVQPGSLGFSFPDAGDPQQPADVAIVMPTVLRPVIVRAIASIYQQNFQGRIQILIGVDKPLGPLEPLLELLARRPSHVSALVLQLPWSTSARHGGMHTAIDTGALRTILSYMVNSRAVAYLDDDNILLDDHLRLLHAALQGKAWSWSQRMLVDERNDRDLAVDRWDSVGPDRGRMASQGGFVDTNCLMLDKVLCSPILGRWAESGQGKPGLTADRHLFAALRRAPYGRVEKATVRYYIRPTNILHQFMQIGQEF